MLKDTHDLRNEVNVDLPWKLESWCNALSLGDLNTNFHNAQEDATMTLRAIAKMKYHHRTKTWNTLGYWDTIHSASFD